MSVIPKQKTSRLIINPFKYRKWYLWAFVRNRNEIKLTAEINATITIRTIEIGIVLANTIPAVNGINNRTKGIDRQNFFPYLRIFKPNKFFHRVC